MKLSIVVLPGLLSSLIVPPHAALAQQRAGAAADTQTVAQEALIRAAAERSIPLLRARLDPRLAEMDARSARATFDPVLRGSSGLSRAEGSLFTGSGAPDAWGDFDADLATWEGGVEGLLASGARYSLLAQSRMRKGDPTLPTGLTRGFDSSLGISLTQPLLKGFGPRIARARVEDADLGHQQALLTMNRATEEVIAEVSRLYWALDAAERVEQARRASLERASRLHERQQELLRLERISESELLTARVGVVRREADVISASQTRADALERMLYFAYGDEAPGRIREADILETDTCDVVIPELSDMETEERAALASRADLQAVELEVERARVGLRMTKNSRLPELGLTGGYSFGADNASAFGFSREVLARVSGSARSQGWSAGLMMSWPLLDRGAGARHEQAKALLAQAELARTEAENRVRSEVRAAARSIEAGWARRERAAEAVRLAREQFANEQSLLDLGRSDPFRVLQMEEQLADAEDAELLAHLALALAVVDYRLASGSLLKTYFPQGR